MSIGNSVSLYLGSQGLDRRDPGFPFATSSRPGYLRDIGCTNSSRLPLKNDLHWSLIHISWIPLQPQSTRVTKVHPGRVGHGLCRNVGGHPARQQGQSGRNGGALHSGCDWKRCAVRLSVTTDCVK
jgi:hypothetical protein